MAKWHGNIGYIEEVEVEPGVWDTNEIVRLYYGDLIRNSRILQNSEGVNDNVRVGNQISIVADPYANQNFHLMQYVEFMGTKRKVETVEVQYPRLILSIGGVYNGK